MQTFTLRTGSWMQRLVGRNPLVRATDRVEALGLLIVLVLALLVVPIAGAAGTAVFDAGTRAAADRQLHVQRVEATATGDTTGTTLPFDSSLSTPLRWGYAGHDHTAVSSTSKSMKTGDRIAIWVDAQGIPTVAPLSRSDVVAEAVIAAVVLWATVAGACTGVWKLYRWWLDKLRYASWDRAIADLVADNGRRNYGR